MTQFPYLGTNYPNSTPKLWTLAVTEIINVKNPSHPGGYADHAESTEGVAIESNEQGKISIVITAMRSRR